MNHFKKVLGNTKTGKKKSGKKNVEKRDDLLLICKIKMAYPFCSPYHLKVYIQGCSNNIMK